MANNVARLRELLAADVFTEASVMNVLQGSADSRYGIIKRAMKTGEIVRLKRGVYSFGPKLQKKGINLFQLAQTIYGPSYVSLESALSHHGWIPEGVFSVTNVSARRSKDVKTPLGVFSYANIPSNDFWAGVERVDDANGVYLMATPWRALADYVYVHKLDWEGFEPVIGSLRVDPSRLQTAKNPLIEELEKATRSERVRVFLKGIRKECFT